MMKNAEETFKELQYNFQRLNEENKRLRLKARSTNVLNNLLENSQDENKQHKEHILELQLKDDQTSTSEEPLIYQVKTSSGGGDFTCRDLLVSNDSNPHYDISKFEDPLLADQSPLDVEHVIPEDIKVLQENVQVFQHENNNLCEEVENLSELLSNQDIGDDYGEIIADLTQLHTKLQKDEKDMHIRKSVSDILANVKETLEYKITEAISNKV